MQFPDKNDRRVSEDSVSFPPPPVQEGTFSLATVDACTEQNGIAFIRAFYDCFDCINKIQRIGTGITQNGSDTHSVSQMASPMYPQSQA